jgi:hypothetical protein
LTLGRPRSTAALSGGAHIDRQPIDLLLAGLNPRAQEQEP